MTTSREDYWHIEMSQTIHFALLQCYNKSPFDLSLLSQLNDTIFTLCVCVTAQLLGFNKLLINSVSFMLARERDISNCWVIINDLITHRWLIASLASWRYIINAMIIIAIFLWKRKKMWNSMKWKWQIIISNNNNEKCGMQFFFFLWKRW